MKKTYISPLTETVAINTEGFMKDALSWTDPDGNRHPVQPGNPTTDPDNDPDEAKGYSGWSLWDE